MEVREKPSDNLKGGNGMEALLMGLQGIRLKKGLSLEQLADLSGIDHERIAMFEGNPESVRNMHLGTACQISRALQCNVLDLHPDNGWRGRIHCAEDGLREIRRTRGYTQSELSEMTGPSAEYLLVRDRLPFHLRHEAGYCSASVGSPSVRSS